MSNRDTNKDISEVEQVESVRSKELNNSDDRSIVQYDEKQNIFVRFRNSIYTKPEKTHNAWHLLTNLTNTQRITFVAGKPNTLYSITSTN